MQLSPEATELTTAVTDALLAVVALGGMRWLARCRSADPAKVRLWRGVLGLLAVASGLGAVAHGLDLSDGLRLLIWQPLNLSLGLLVALFVVAAVHDRSGAGAARRLLVPALLVGAGFYLVTLAFPHTFFVFVLYEAVAMALALALYIQVAVATRRPWAGLMVEGILLNLLAAAIQATEIARLTVGVPLDHNGIFHLVQIGAVVVLVAGVTGSLEDQEPASGAPAGTSGTPSVTSPGA